MANATMQQDETAVKEQPKRYKKFGFEIYEDSCPEFEKLARETKMQILASPWHDSDLKEDGSLKKKHRHIFVNLGQSNWSVKQIMDFIQRFGAQHFEEIMNNRGYIRYFIHIDDPDKAQYKKEDILSFGGAKFELHFDDVAKSNSINTLRGVLEYCRANEIDEYSVLVDDILDNGNDDDLEYVFKNAYAISSYLKSKRFKSKEKKEQDFHCNNLVGAIKEYEKAKADYENLANMLRGACDRDYSML